MSLQFRHIVFARMYGLLWNLSKVFLRRHKRLRDGFALRLVPDNWAKPCDIWLQAASGGEAYLVWEVLQRLQVRHDAPLRILVTTWTRQGLEVLQGMKSSLENERSDMHIQLALFPLDLPKNMYKAMRMTRPKLMVLFETELWPGLLLACTRCKVPVMVLNGRMTAKSLRGYTILEKIVPGFWHAVAPCCIRAMAKDDRERFAKVFGQSPDIEVTPNIKFDRALPHVSTPQDNTLLGLFAAEKRILFASVRQEEEAIILEALTTLYKTQPAASILLVPRHMHRVKAWLEMLQEKALPTVLRSTLTEQNTAPCGHIVLWDTFGELSQTYAIADAVFVGGSLAPLGGQNFLEALEAGLVPCVGPYIDNFSWAIGDETEQNLRTKSLLVTCHDATSLVQVLTAQMQNPLTRESVQKDFRHWLNPRLGGSAQSAALVDKAMAQSMPDLV